MTALTLFEQAVPAHIKAKERNELTKSLAGNTGTKKISIRGSVFRLVVGGEEVAKNENRAMNVVVVGGAPNVFRTYHAGKYVAGESSAPDCWSNDGKRPDASIESPQGSLCETCPQNIKGSGQNDSRACKYHQYLAVVLADDVGGDVYQLILPSKSYFGRGDSDNMPFQQYAKYVSSQGHNIDDVVTEMRLDSDSDTPKLVFRPVRFLNAEETEAATAQGRSDATRAAITRVAMKKKEAPKLQIAPAPQAAQAEEPVEEPKKRTAKKNVEPAPKKDFADVINSWSTDDDE